MLAASGCVNSCQRVVMLRMGARRMKALSIRRGRRRGGACVRRRQYRAAPRECGRQCLREALL